MMRVVAGETGKLSWFDFMSCPRSSHETSHELSQSCTVLDSASVNTNRVKSWSEFSPASNTFHILLWTLVTAKCSG